MKKAMFTGLLLLASSFSFAQIAPETKEEALTNCDDLAQVTTPVPPKPDRYEFAKAVIASLWYANRATQIKETEQAKADGNASAFSIVTAMMRDSKFSTNNYICAKRALRPFTAKKYEENISVAAQALWIAYQQNIELNERALALIKKIGEIPQAEFMDKISTLQVERSERIKDLTQPSSLALMLLIDSKADEQGHATYLNITKEQKKVLWDWAVDHFPEFKQEGSDRKWTDPAADAHLLYNLFEGRKCVDEEVVATAK
jgi:hypothetical protein